MILYFDCAAQALTSIQPDMTNKQLVDMPWPNTTPMGMAMQWITAIGGLSDQQLPLVFRVTIAEAE